MAGCAVRSVQNISWHLLVMPKSMGYYNVTRELRWICEMPLLVKTTCVYQYAVL